MKDSNESFAYKAGKTAAENMGMVASKGHKHATLMALYAQDAAETAKPWLRWEIKTPNATEWSPACETPSWSPFCDYRRKPRTIHINGFEVPEPFRGRLELKQKYWVIAVSSRCALFNSWCASDLERYWMAAGLIHLTKEAAELHRKALLSFTEVKSCAE